MTSSIAAVPRLIAETGLLSFISRRNLEAGRFTPALVELPNPDTTMTRQFGVVHRNDGYLSPAARRIIEIVREQNETTKAPATRRKSIAAKDGKVRKQPSRDR
jgi:DNA-binding transcriptional LysR family regulator